MTDRFADSTDMAGDAWTILHAVCRRVGLDPSGAELLRLRSNAVFKLRAPIVVRIATSPNAVTRLPAVLQVTRWLADRGFPTVEPAEEIADQPLIHDSVAVTFWRYIPTAGRAASTQELGRLLRDLHTSPPPPIALRRLTDPLASVRAAVHHLPNVLDPGEQTWLSERVNTLTDAWTTLPFASEPTLLHGDAWIDNLMRHRDGHVILGDWDSVALGPREWDLIHTYHGQHRFGLTPQDVDAFATAYGHDLSTWPGYETLMQIRDLYAIGIHIRNAPGDPFSRKELARRLASLKNGTHHDRWHMKNT